MEKRNYSQQIADFIKDFLEEKEWKYYFDEEEGYFRLDFGLDSKLQTLVFRIRIANDAILVLGFCPVGPDPDNREMMLNVAEYFTLINYELTYGTFVMDMEDGEIRFRVYIDCEGGLPNKVVLENAIFVSIHYFEKAADGLLEILFADKTAATAYLIWKSKKLRDIFEELIGKAITEERNPKIIECLSKILEDDDDDEQPEILS